MKRLPNLCGECGYSELQAQTSSLRADGCSLALPELRICHLGNPVSSWRSLSDCWPKVSVMCPFPHASAAIILSRDLLRLTSWASPDSRGRDYHFDQRVRHALGFLSLPSPSWNSFTAQNHSSEVFWFLHSFPGDSELVESTTYTSKPGMCFSDLLRPHQVKDSKSLYDRMLSFQECHSHLIK